VEDSIEPGAESDFQWALRETDRLGEVINQLLELARVEEGEKKPTVIEVAQLIRDRADTWSTVANQSGVELVVDAPPETWISAVDGTVEQILDNLLSNALKVAPSESTVTLRVIPAGQIVEVHVIDEGPGLTEADRVNAMQRFWRGAAEGTGLGLAIVNRLAEASGGTARLDSSASGGVDALITMPAVSPQTTHLSSRRAHQSSATSQPDGT
jgi:signal transduction histidine kinase